MKNNPDRHIWLYAKGWYKRTNILEDLRKIISYRNGIEEHYISDRDILNIISNLAFPYINTPNKFNMFITECYKDFNYTKKYNSDLLSIKRLIREFLRVLCGVVVKNSIGTYIINMGKPDYNLLPKNIIN